jgi:hypothetical protein
MHLGYEWTSQIAGLLSLAQNADLAGDSSTSKHAEHRLERLAGMDIDPWIVGRRTASKHIWARWCSGRTGIEQTTGLPRPLLDLIATASLRKDNSAELRKWSLSLDPRDCSPARYHIWQAYAFATLLYLHSIQITILGNMGALTDAVRTHVEQFRKALPLEPELNARMALWPLYVVGTLAADDQSRSYVTQALHDELFYSDFQSKNLIGEILEETWARVDAGGLVTTDTVARERNVELAIW